ncbi:MAG TPA: septal ring lytic transglycosylase RlpA family protein [Terriglobales bacterium]|nr:septal ring lytic transglycosylase RlpA family protein [Terriglobales bacterium]
MRASVNRLLSILVVCCLLPLLLTGCGEKKRAHVDVPPPPLIEPQTPQAPSNDTPRHDVHGNPASTEAQPETAQSANEEDTDQESTTENEDKDVPSLPAGTKPILVETGLASWYGAPYHNRRGSNGEIYNMNAMTAAHRTLPLGSIIRVTNVKTGHSATVRVTDRGPFIKGRILDLSLAAAKKVDVWQPGTSTVRVEVLQAARSLDQGGRWAVQIGAFHEEGSANELVSQLSRRYHSAKVLSFSSPVGDWWISVRVKNDDRKRAEEVAHDSQTPQGSIFLVRLD